MVVTIILWIDTENFHCDVQEKSKPGFERQGPPNPGILFYSNSRADSYCFRGWWPLPSHSDRPPLSGLVGPLSLASRVLCLAPGPHAAAERTQLLAQRGQRARLGVVSGFMYIEFHA